MSQPKLPMPNPDEWMTMSAAAAFMGVHPVTVHRMARAGIIKSYAPIAQVGEKPAPMFWAPEVERIRDARKAAGMKAGD